MGWMDSHLHSFTIEGQTHSRSLEQGDLTEMKMLEQSGHSLAELLGDTVKMFIYEYEFGDGWQHRIDVEAVGKPDPDREYPVCLAGARAAPPDDAGGVPGCEAFLTAIRTPRHEEHDSMLTWIGGAFDPEGFDLNPINRTLRVGIHPATARAGSNSSKQDRKDVDQLPLTAMSPFPLARCMQVAVRGQQITSPNCMTPILARSLKGQERRGIGAAAQ